MDEIKPKRKGDSDSKKRWDKANVLFVTTKIFRTTDADIMAYLNGKNRGETIKKALRIMMNQEGFVYKKPEQ